MAGAFLQNSEFQDTLEGKKEHITEVALEKIWALSVLDLDWDQKFKLFSSKLEAPGKILSYRKGMSRYGLERKAWRKRDCWKG